MQLLMYMETRENKYKQVILDYMNDWKNGVVPHTPKGLAWRLAWGSLRYAGEISLVSIDILHMLYAMYISARLHIEMRM